MMLRAKTTLERVRQLFRPPIKHAYISGNDAQAWHASEPLPVEDSDYWQAVVADPYGRRVLLPVFGSKAECRAASRAYIKEQR